MSGRINPKAAAHIKGAQLLLVEHALVEFVESVLGRSFSDDEIMRCGLHLDFTGSAIPTFSKDGKDFHKFYCWDCREVMALGFLDADDPLKLSVVRIAQPDWPFPVRMSINDERGRRGTET